MANKTLKVDDAICPCGIKVEYVRCCGRYLDGGEIPQTAEQLKRSRYCGFVLCDEPYLLISWHPDTGYSSEIIGNCLCS
jgi:SEC-C motif-containing protein